MKYRKTKWFGCIFSFILLAILFINKRYIQTGIGIQDVMAGGNVGQQMIISSRESGYYADPFELELSALAGMEIYYTTDCSRPTKESSRYESPIWISDASKRKNVWANLIVPDDKNRYVVPEGNIDKATVIRAVLYDGNRKIGKEAVFTYFVGLENAKVYASLPLVSIVSDGDGLFDEETGIYVQYEKRGKAYEREAHMDFFDENFCLNFSMNCGIRIRGGVSREQAQKGFNIYAREEYGSVAIENVFDRTGKSLDSLALMIEYDDVKVKDIIPYELSEDLNIGTQESFPCNLFLNGEYWGIYFVTERFDCNYFARHYGVSDQDVLMIKADSVEIGEAEDFSYYQELLDFVKNNDLSKEENYAHFLKMVDIDSLIDYYCLECYLYNQDWPYNNYALWRTKNKSGSSMYSDGRWRFLVYDTNYQEAMHLDSGKDNPYLLLKKDKLVPYLMTNQKFCEKFATRMCDMANTVAEVYRVEELLDDLGNQIGKSVSLSEKRFYGNKEIDLEERLYNDVCQFFYIRSDYIIECTKNTLMPEREVSNLVIVMDVSSSGIVKINGLPIDLSAGSWEGKYYTNLPIRIEAVPGDGYHFKGWQVVSQEDRSMKESICNILLPKEGIVIKAIFERE